MQLNLLVNRFYKNILKNPKKFVYIPLVVYWIFLFVMTSLPTIGVPAFGVSDKFYHFGAYFVLAVLLGLTLFVRSINNTLASKYIIYSLIILNAYSVFDEVHQIFIEGRFFDWFDMLANFCGIIFALYIVNKFVAFNRKLN